MAFNDEVAATLAGNGGGKPAPDVQAQTGRPDDATMPQSATAPAAPAPSPTPAPSANQPAQPAQPEPQPPALIHPHHRSMFGALASALIGGTLGTIAKGTKAVAGPQPADYTTDANGRVIRDPNQRPDTTASRLQRIAEAALMGLSYGVQAGPQKSAAASWAAGLGAGAQGQMQNAQGQDLLKRKQAQEQFEAEQKTLTDKAVRAMHNASTYSLWAKAMQEQNDHDAERAKNMDLVNAINDYNSQHPESTLKAQIVSPEAASAMREQDAHSVAKHTFLPLGFAPAKGADGQPLFEQDGVTPKQVGQVAVISGNGNIPLPQSFVDDLKEYGRFAQVSGGETIKAGQEVPLLQFLNMDKRMNAVKTAEIDPKNVSYSKQKDGSWLKVSSITGKSTSIREEQVPQTAKSTQAEIELRDAEAFKNRAEGKKAAGEAGSQGQQKMWEEGQNPSTGEKLNLSNAPDTMMVNQNGQPIPFKMLSTMKPTQQESNRADFAKSTLHTLDLIDGLRQRGKVPNGPLTGLNAKTLAKFGLGSDSQEALDLVGFAQSASTGAHVGGRFNQEIMKKMDTMLNMNMNDEQFSAAEQGIRDVMKPYADQGGRLTVGEYKADLLGRVPVGKVAVQIPGREPGFIPQERLKDFKTKHPNAVILQ